MVDARDGELQQSSTTKMTLFHIAPDGERHEFSISPVRYCSTLSQFVHNIKDVASCNIESIENIFFNNICNICHKRHVSSEETAFFNTLADKLKPFGLVSEQGAPDLMPEFQGIDISITNNKNKWLYIEYDGGGGHVDPAVAANALYFLGKDITKVLNSAYLYFSNINPYE